MKKIVLFILLLSHLSCFSSAVLKGTITNSKSEFINLTYMGSSIINSPNYHGEKRNFSEIMNESFELEFNTSNEYSLYILEFPNDSINFKILIKNHDTLHINIDFKNVPNTFLATGANATMTNYLFAEKFISYSSIPKESEKLISFWNDYQQDMKDLVKSFKNNNIINSGNYNSNSRSIIQRLIKNSILSNQDFIYLLNRTNYYITNAIRRTPYDYRVKHIEDYLKLYSDIELSENYIVNDYATDELVRTFVSISLIKEAICATSSNNRKVLQKYITENYNSLVGKVIHGNQYEKLISDNLYGYLIAGKYNRYEKEKDLISNNIYKKKLDDFYSNYLNSSQYSDFDLFHQDKETSDTTFEKVLKSFSGDTIYLTFWHPNASYSLTPMWNLMTMNKLKENYSERVRFVNICIGDISKKKHWASLIINHNWIGEHYFSVDQTDSKLRNYFEIDNFRSCNGELYYLLSETGDIIRNNGSEMILHIE